MGSTLNGRASSARWRSRSVDRVWQFTAEDVAALPLDFTFVADQTRWPANQILEPNPRDPPTPGGLSGPLIDEASRGLAGDGSSNDVIPVQAGIYRFTVWAPLDGAAAHHTIVKQ
jgi:hypothetical protein